MVAKQNPRYLWTVAACVCTFGIQACALPGYSVKDDADESPWFAFSSDDPRYQSEGALAEEENTPDYVPEIYEITPELITTKIGQPEPPREIEIPSPDKDSDYRVGPGDVLNFTVYNHPELTNPGGIRDFGGSESIPSGQLVNAQGEIFFPFVGETEVAGLTLKQIRKKLADGLSSVIREPQIDVRVSQFRSQQVFVAGDIAKPCAVPVTDIPLTVLRALDSCGSLGGGNSDSGAGPVSNVRLSRNGAVYPLDLIELYRSGEPVPLQDGDRLIIDRSASRVFIVGEFGSQTTTPVPAAGLTLNDAIANGGGIDLTSANPAEIYVIRGFLKTERGADGELLTSRKPRLFHLDAKSVDSLILADQFQLQPRDVVYAAPASLVSLNRALALILPSINSLFRAVIISDRVGGN